MGALEKWSLFDLPVIFTSAFRVGRGLTQDHHFTVRVLEGKALGDMDVEKIKPARDGFAIGILEIPGDGIDADLALN